MKDRAMTAAVKRHAGMSPERREEVKKAHEEFSDWFGVCRHCGETITGTPKELREHRCGTVN